jgi:MFS family permease
LAQNIDKNTLKSTHRKAPMPKEKKHHWLPADEGLDPNRWMALGVIAIASLMIGLAGFALASLIGGFSQNQGELFAMRGLQGAFGAFLAPSSLSLLNVTFTVPKERAKAFGVYGGISGGGAAIGLIMGGLLTEYAN